MVEETLRKLDEPPTKNQLWRALPKAVMWQTFGVVLAYLADSNKIVFDRNGRIVWVFADNKKLKKLLKDSIPYRR
ncbi:MAG: hypothetical protein JW778_04430 [Candidatus Altiarchaeota archaeon]|nr:hypothetical protein [Candidatus Altiarchaeota archaeon]